MEKVKRGRIDHWLDPKKVMLIKGSAQEGVRVGSEADCAAAGVQPSRGE
ncbi:hypothetical protein GGE24_007654 [Bradyrhizobium centrosematis]|nr:hypothetical protein [Bradyrhizobium centrosematis]MCS3765842.1 hypothetical protein [Bradyrhizobium centrosematis]MCS3778277.1 hypothetical protein [Bradyrhizobium centrosematis]